MVTPHSVAYGWSHVTKQMINEGGPMVRTFCKMAENNDKWRRPTGERCGIQ